MEDHMFTSRHGHYIEIETDELGEQSAFYCAPDGVRPPHWPARRQLPQTGSRKGSIHAPQLRDRIRNDIRTLDSQIEVFWKRRALSASESDFSVTKLAELYRLDDDKPHPYGELEPESKKRVNLNILKIARWAEENACVNFSKIERFQISEFLELYKDRPSQRVQMKNALGHLMAVAVREQWRDDDPMKFIRISDPPKPEREFWTHRDVQACAEAARDLGHPAIGAMIIFLSATGQRYGDVLTMRHGHEYADGYIRFRQAKRRAAINFKVSEHLNELVEQLRVPGSDFLFTHPETRTGYSPHQAASEFQKVRELARYGGGPHLTLQTLRHTCVVRMIAEDVHPFKIAAMTGHKYSSMDSIMERYGIRSADAALDAAKALNRASGGTDDDFGVYEPEKANWAPRTAVRRPLLVGIAKTRAVQFLKRNLDHADAEVWLEQIYTVPEDETEKTGNRALESPLVWQ